MKFLLSLLLPFYIVTTNANDLNEFDSKYYEIKDIHIEEIETAYEDYRTYEVENQKDLGAAIMTAQKLIAFGKQVWAIIEKGRPVVNVNSMKPISVLPKVTDRQIDTFDMSGWKSPKVRSYRVTYTNGFNMTVIAFTYNVVFQYGGSYEGKGSYLTGVNVTASDVDVAWGFNFNAVSKLVNITNTGSSANPVASAVIEITYRAKSVVKDITSKRSFYVTGKGEVKRLF